MIAIDPDKTHQAANHLRGRARLVRDLEIDIRRAAVLADLSASHVIAACLEIEEELRLLASILSSRANEASGFRLPGAGLSIPGFDHPSRGPGRDTTSALLASLLDNVGARAVITGPLAARILLEHSDQLGLGHDESSLSIATLREISHDPRAAPELAAAAAFFVRNPTFVADTNPWQANGRFLPSAGPGKLALDDLQVFVARNDILATIIGRGRAGIDPSDLSTMVTDADLVDLGIDPVIYGTLNLPRRHHDLLVTAIEHGTGTHTPAGARSLIDLLPVHLDNGESIDLGAASTTAVQHLYVAATRDLTNSLDDFIVRNVVTSQLPETATGFRNKLFSAGYAEWAAWFNSPVNGNLSPTSRSFRGHNWFHLGVVASDSVGSVLRGGERALTLFAIPDPVRQEIADGNQAIFAHFTREIARHVRDEPLESLRLNDAFDRLVEAGETEDVASAQYLAAEATALFALEEQRIVDPYLQLDGAGLLERIGTRAVTFLFDQDPLTSRSVEQVMTDEGQLRFEIDGTPIRPSIDIGVAVPESTQPNNHVDRAELRRRLPPTLDWTRNVADEWAVYDQRMPIIVDVAIATLTDPALTAMAEHHRRGDLQAPTEAPPTPD